MLVICCQCELFHMICVHNTSSPVMAKQFLNYRVIQIVISDHYLRHTIIIKEKIIGHHV